MTQERAIQYDKLRHLLTICNTEKYSFYLKKKVEFIRLTEKQIHSTIVSEKKFCKVELILRIDRFLGLCIQTPIL